MAVAVLQQCQHGHRWTAQMVQNGLELEYVSEAETRCPICREFCACLVVETDT